MSYQSMSSVALLSAGVCAVAAVLLAVVSVFAVKHNAQKREEQARQAHEQKLAKFQSVISGLDAEERLSLARLVLWLHDIYPAHTGARFMTKKLPNVFTESYPGLFHEIQAFYGHAITIAYRNKLGTVPELLQLSKEQLDITCQRLSELDDFIQLCVKHAHTLDRYSYFYFDTEGKNAAGNTCRMSDQEYAMPKDEFIGFFTIERLKRANEALYGSSPANPSTIAA